MASVLDEILDGEEQELDAVRALIHRRRHRRGYHRRRRLLFSP